LPFLPLSTIEWRDRDADLVAWIIFTGGMISEWWYVRSEFLFHTLVAHRTLGLSAASFVQITQRSAIKGYMLTGSDGFVAISTDDSTIKSKYQQPTRPGGSLYQNYSNGTTLVSKSTSVDGAGRHTFYHTAILPKETNS
jgi:hypothetical protein